MLLTEWNMDDALAVAREEALEDGIGIGIDKGIGIGRNEGHSELFALWEKGVSLAEAKELLRG